MAASLWYVGCAKGQGGGPAVGPIVLVVPRTRSESKGARDATPSSVPLGDADRL